MLKDILFVAVFLSTALRLGGITYLLVVPGSHLQVITFVVSSAVVLLGALLIFRRFFLSLQLRGYMVFFVFQGVAYLFNIIYAGITNPLRLTALEIMVTGTFLDVLIAACAVSSCLKQMKKGFTSIGGAL